MKIAAILTILVSLIGGKAYGTNDVPMNDTIHLLVQHVEGRWVGEENDTKRIYIFNSDSTFFKANDNKDLLFFNIAGRYRLLGDTIRVVYQDLSRGNARKAKIRTMYLQVIALSDKELNINKTENNKTSFIRLRRQN